MILERGNSLKFVRRGRMDTDSKIKEIIQKADFSKGSDLKDKLLKQLLDLNRNIQDKEKEEQEEGK